MQQCFLFLVNISKYFGWYRAGVANTSIAIDRSIAEC